MQAGIGAPNRLTAELYVTLCDEILATGLPVHRKGAYPHRIGTRAHPQRVPAGEEGS